MLQSCRREYSAWLSVSFILASASAVTGHSNEQQTSRLHCVQSYKCASRPKNVSCPKVTNARCISTSVSFRVMWRSTVLHSASLIIAYSQHSTTSCLPKTINFKPHHYLTCRFGLNVAMRPSTSSKLLCRPNSQWPLYDL